MTMAIFFNYNTYNYNSNYNISFDDNNTSITTQFHLMTTSLFSKYNQHNYNSNYNIFQWHQHSVHNTHIHILHYHICQWPQHFNYNLIFITIFITIMPGDLYYNDAMLGVYRYAPCCNWYVVNDMWHLHSVKLQFTNTMFNLMIALWHDNVVIDQCSIL
jgi:hypothetical protein